MPSLDEIGYVPIPSVGHELGIMFGFLGAMALSMIVYVLFWRAGTKRGARKEAERIEALRASGFLKEKQQEAEEERTEDTREVHI